MGEIGDYVFEDDDYYGEGLTSNRDADEEGDGGADEEDGVDSTGTNTIYIDTTEKPDKKKQQ
jgi:hypothetical protein